MQAEGLEVAEEVTEDNYAAQLQEQTIAVSLSVSAFGVNRRLTDVQAEAQAAAFHANPDFVAGSKKLLDRRHKAFRAVTKVIGAAKRYWKDATVPYPEPGIRLLKMATGSAEDNIQRFTAEIERFKAELEDAVQELESVYQSELIPAARQSLGELFQEEDYPPTLIGSWSIDAEFPAVGPDERLRELNPELFEAERARAEARFQEAVLLSEQALISELERCVAQLVDRLTPQEVHVYRYTGESSAELQKLIDQTDTADTDTIDALVWKIEFSEAESIHRRGNRLQLKFPESDRKDVRKVFDTEDECREYIRDRDAEFVRAITENKQFTSSSIENIHSFFDRFAEMNLGQNSALDEVVEQAKEAVSGVTVAHVRDCNVEQRQQVVAPISQVADALEELMVPVRERAIRVD